MEFITNNIHLLEYMKYENMSSPDEEWTIPLAFWYMLSVIGIVILAITFCVECVHRFRRRHIQIALNDSEERETENINTPLNEYRREQSFHHPARETQMTSSYAYREARLTSPYETHEISELERTYEEHKSYEEIPKNPPPRSRTCPIPITKRYKADESHSDEFYYPSSSAACGEDYLPSSSDDGGLPTGSSLGYSSSEGILNGTKYKDIPQPRYGYSSMSTVCADDYLPTYPTDDEARAPESTVTEDETQSPETGEVFPMEES